MGRRKKSINKQKAEVFDYEEQQLIDRADYALLCEKCPSKNLREMQDTINFMFGAIKMVAPYINCDNKDWKIMCENLKKWSYEQRKLRFELARKKIK